ncbi:MAG: TatD family hydrolase [Chitinispirillales bacterium]|jgi:TatD DNase family protein|nr:TatD family hydrolase [Chitinispirillales bacterium]
MFDSHCHLQDRRIVDSVDDIISKARRAGVDGFLCCGTTENDWADVAKIGAIHSGAICAFGIHPWYVDEVSDGWDDVLKKYIADDNRAAIGEIGLDNTVKPRNDNRQIDIFVRQLEIADELKRPVSIHCRRAWESILKILKARGGLRYGGAIHSYSGPAELVDELQKLGCHISFSGSIINDKNKRAAESLKKVSPNRLLVETDSPDILPPNIPGPTNEPANLQLIINKIAEITEKAPEEITSLTRENGMRLFINPARQ